MPNEVRHRIQTPHVISETIDGETIIINLETGHYFSLNATGGEVWNDLKAGLSAAQIEEACQLRYPESGDTIASPLSEFFAALEGEGLIAPEEVADAAAPSLDPKPAASGKAFERPALQKYEDMQDLLLLDPIHEVDEMGWPLTRNSA